MSYQVTKIFNQIPDVTLHVTNPNAPLGATTESTSDSVDVDPAWTIPSTQESAQEIDCSAGSLSNSFWMYWGTDNGEDHLYYYTDPDTQVVTDVGTLEGGPDQHLGIVSGGGLIIVGTTDILDED